MYYFYQFLPHSTNFCYPLPVFINFYTSSINFCHLLPPFTSFYQSLPFLSTFILHFKLFTIFHQLTTFDQSKMVLFFIHLLTCTNPILLVLDSILWASILCLSIFYMLCFAYILHQGISLI